MNSRHLEPPVGRIRSSITNKLQTRLFFRLLGLFICINIIICIAFSVSLLVYCEQKAARVCRDLKRHGYTEFQSTISDIEIQISESSSLSQQTFPMFFPNDTGSSQRAFRARGFGFESTILSIRYVVFAAHDGVTYEITQRIGPAVLVFIYAFFALCTVELLLLLTRSARDRRMVRRTLDPISELARAAQSLNNVSSALDHDKMAALTGRLSGIDADKLDTRLQVDDLQEELRNLAVAINGMLDRINESYIAQARFVSDASHELRTPISVIQGYANLLDRWGKNDEKTLTESITAIKDEAANMKELVEQLLFLARGDSDSIKLDMEHFSLSQLAEEAVSEAEMIDTAHQYKLKLSETELTADRPLIKNVLRILIDNAVKYTDSGGDITVSVSTEGDTVVLSVTDDGIGISPEVLPFIFNRFVRADDSRARSTGGAGLGLAIAKWIVSRHCGTMEVISRESIGTRVTVRLPIAATETKAI